MTTQKYSIWPPFEVFYIQSMLFNSSSAVRSISRLHAILETLQDEVTLEQLDRLPTKKVLDELQNMVLQAASLSRYFWPVRKEYEARGMMLREVFAIDKTNPLFNRDLRNATEHFDERLDKYVAKGIVGYVLPEYVGMRPSDEGVAGHFFRAYFVDNAAFRLLDEEFPMQPLAEALILLHDQLVAMDEDGGRLRLICTSSK